MVKFFEVYLSNSLEVLYQYLKQSLFGSLTRPFMRRLVVVYGPAMKTWLTLRMAKDHELNVATGIEFIYLNQAFDHLLKLSSNSSCDHFPTLIELALGIEKEFMSIFFNYKHLNPEEQRDWEPLIRYFKLNPHETKLSLSRKMEKRLVSLSHNVARLFQDYGRYAGQMVAKWESNTLKGWQSRLWCQIFGEKTGWTYPEIALRKAEMPTIPFTLYFFSISFITATEFSYLKRLSEHVPIHYYLLSPCAVFWSDIRSDREHAYLQNYWQQKLGAFSPQVLKLEELLRDRNPLLANFGRLGREMASQIEECQAETHTLYILPQHVQALDGELCMGHDFYFADTQEPLSLLHALQADLLTMRNPQGLPPFNFEEEKGSLQLHIAPGKRREVEILYHNLLGLISKDPSLSPGDVIVMAPQIEDYVPYVQTIFGTEESQIDFQILDLAMQTQSEITQGFLQLLELSESRWDVNQLLQLFGHASFQRRHQLTSSDFATIQEWIEQAGICWGDDWMHRNELLHRRHCQQGMVEETKIGTWEYGLSRLLNGLATTFDSKSLLPLEIPPCSSIDFSQGELLGNWIHLLQSLRDDLSPLQDSTRMTMEDWGNYLNCLLENYFQPNGESSQSVKEYDDLISQFDILRNSARYFKDTTFSFTSVKSHLLALLQHRGMTYREDHLQSVRFCSLMPLRSIPAKVMAILGLEEGTFPQSNHHSSLNLMVGSGDVDYCPLSTDYDRYLFLEALHSAQDYLFLSCQGYGQHDGKELQPSLIVTELFSYLDQFYMIEGSKVSEKCIFKHPFDAFDHHYFNHKRGLVNFSHDDYRAAQIVCNNQQFPPHSFLSDFGRIEHPMASMIENNAEIDLKNLTAAARNPIRFHLNKVLEIYLQTEEDRKRKIEEELVLSSLEKYLLKQQTLHEPVEAVITKAEKEGKLPFGLFKTVAIKRLKEEIEDVHQHLQKHEIERTNIFQIEFCTNCSNPIQLEENSWIFPAVTLNYEDGYKLSVKGKLSHVTSKGLFVLSKGTIGDVWKVWPQFLLYCFVAKQFPEKLESQLIFSQSAQPKKAFFDDPESYLKQFINYYALCLQHFSPLLPDWLPFILEGNVRGLQEKMEQLFSESFGVYQNQDLLWILNKSQLPSSETLIKDWKAQAEHLLGDIIRFWYPSKLEKA
jgi:exodeoxyribonuclease V gamma subunit